MNDKEIEKQIHDIIEGEIQNNINEYLEKNPEEQKGFDKDAKLNVNVSPEIRQLFWNLPFLAKRRLLFSNLPPK